MEYILKFKDLVVNIINFKLNSMSLKITANNDGNELYLKEIFSF